MERRLFTKNVVPVRFWLPVCFLFVLNVLGIHTPSSLAASGHIRIDPAYPHSFKYDDGARYFPMGDTAYYLLSEDEATIRAYIDSRRASNFNFIRIGAIGRNFWPLGGTPASPNYFSINETQMRKLDRVFDYAAGKGMNIELILWTYGREGGNGMWGDSAKENFWVDTIVNRYKNRENLFLWTVANEFERYPDGLYSYAPSDVDWARRIASRIKSIDPVHAVGAHPSPWISPIPPYNPFNSYNGISQRLPQVVWPLWEGSDITVFNVQNNQGVQQSHWASSCPGGTGACQVYEPTTWRGTYYPATWDGFGWNFEGPGMEDSIAEDWSHGKPVINTEFGYQYESGAETSDPGFATRQSHLPQTVRKKAWKIVTAGGYFAAGFAHTAVWFNSSKIQVWRPEQLAVLYNFFTARTEYWKMAPHLELVADLNSMLALPGIEYVAYFPRGGTNAVNLQAGTYFVEWVNPRTGKITPQGSITVLAGNHDFTPLTEATEDWVLHLRSSGPFPPTSSAPVDPGWRVVYVDSEETNSENGVAENIIKRKGVRSQHLTAPIF